MPIVCIASLVNLGRVPSESHIWSQLVCVLRSIVAGLHCVAESLLGFPMLPVCTMKTGKKSEAGRRWLHAVPPFNGLQTIPAIRGFQEQQAQPGNRADYYSGSNRPLFVRLRVVYGLARFRAGAWAFCH